MESLFPLCLSFAAKTLGKMFGAFLQEAHDDIRLAGVRIGAGRHEIMKHLCDVAIQKKLDLPFSVYSGRCAGMLDFKPPLFSKIGTAPLSKR